MSRELDKLEDDKLYTLQMDMLGFAEEGAVISGADIKEYCPFDVSPHQGVNHFFKEEKE